VRENNRRQTLQSSASASGGLLALTHFTLFGKDGLNHVACQAFLNLRNGNQRWAEVGGIRLNSGGSGTMHGFPRIFISSKGLVGGAWARPSLLPGSGAVAPAVPVIAQGSPVSQVLRQSGTGTWLLSLSFWRFKKKVDRLRLGDSGRETGRGGHLLPSGESRDSLLSKHFPVQSVIFANNSGLPPHPSLLAQHKKRVRRGNQCGYADPGRHQRGTAVPSSCR
jgi:hypothetical protein